MSESLIYITCDNTSEAEEVGRGLLERRLVACVNIFDGMRSMYWWKGELVTGDETVLIGKTKTSLVEMVVDAVKELHSYEVPCVVSMEISGGNPDFLNWIQAETA